MTHYRLDGIVVRGYDCKASDRSSTVMS